MRKKHVRACGGGKEMFKKCNLLQVSLFGMVDSEPDGVA